MCFCKKFLNFKNKIRIESARVEGQIRWKRCVFSRFLKMVRIQLLGLSWAGHSTRWEQLMKKSVKVILCLFGMVQ